MNSDNPKQATEHRSVRLNRRAFLTHLAALGGAAALGAAAGPKVLAQTVAGSNGNGRRPNIVFLLADDLGYMDISPYGGEYYKTPGFERLAEQSVKFTNAYAASPLCSPTRASIITGQYPARLGITAPAGHQMPLPEGAPLFAENGPPHAEVIVPQSKRFLPLEERTLAEVLRDAGYRTSFFGKWHLGAEEKYWPHHQGFEDNFGGTGFPGPPSFFSPYKNPMLPDGPEGEHIDDRLTDEACAWMEQHRDEPFFMCFWHFSVHAPFQAKDEYIEQYEQLEDPRGQQGNPVYAGMVQSLDDSIGRVLTKIEELGLEEDTIIIFFSDNGGNEYDHIERADGMNPTNNYPLRSGKGGIYEGGIRVPMFVKWPGVTEAGSTSDALVFSCDFFPTILDMLGMETPEDQQLDGVSITPVLQGGALERERIFIHFPHSPPAVPAMASTAVRQGPWKLIRFYETNAEFPSRYALFNLEDDIGETKNLAEEMPEKVYELDRHITQFLKDSNAVVPKVNPNYDPAAHAPEPTGNKHH